MFHIVNRVVASHLSSDHMVLPEFAHVARRWEGRKIGGAPLPEEHTRAGSTPLRQQDAGAEEPSEAAAAAPPIKKAKEDRKGAGWGVWHTALVNKPPSSSHELPLWTSTLSRDSHEGRCSLWQRQMSTEKTIITTIKRG